MRQYTPEQLQKRLESIFNLEIEEDIDTLYYKTGYELQDVETVDDYNEIIRLLSSWYYLDRYYID